MWTYWSTQSSCITTIASLYWHKNKLPSSSMVKMALAIFEEAKITNIEMKSHALLEIAPGIHSPVCPYLVEFSACVPPALHMGMTYDFHIGDLGFYKGSLSHFYQWSAWQLFFVSIQARNSSDRWKCIGIYDDIASIVDQMIWANSLKRPNLLMHPICT